MTCNPLQLADSYIGKLRTLESEAEGALEGVPNTLDDLLQCLVFGTADRAASVDQLDSLSLDSLRDRVQQIFNAVEKGTESSLEDLGISSTRDTTVSGLATSGLWMTHGTANTFYGLAIARMEQTVEDIDSSTVLVAQGRLAVTGIRDSLALIRGPQGADLLAAARILQQEICPDIDVIRDKLYAMAASVGSSRSLDKAYCSGQDVLSLIQSLLARLPMEGLEAALALVQAEGNLKKVMDDLLPVQQSIHVAKVMLPTFEDEYIQGGQVPETEKRYLEALADQLIAICEQVHALADARRYSEMVQLGPQVNEIGTLIIDYLERPPAIRLQEIRDHPAAEPLAHMNRILRDTDSPDDGQSALDDVLNSSAAAIVQLSNDLEVALVKVEDYFAAVDDFGTVIKSAASEFIGLGQEVVNTLCTGALRLLLHKIGYEDLEKLYANGVFGQLPTAIFQAMTTANRLTNCLKETLEGGAKLLGVEQAFAIERAVDLLRVVERTDNEVASIAASLDRFGKQPPQVFLKDAADVIEHNLKAGLRSVGVTVGKISGTSQSPDGFVHLDDPTAHLPDGLYADAKGFLKALPGRTPPPGYEAAASGHVRVSTL